MRSFALTAAIAAMLLSSPALAAMSSRNIGTTDPADRAHSRTPNGDNGASAIETTAPVYPLAPQALAPRYMVLHRHSRLSYIDAELGQADRRIDIDRHRGHLTATEARALRRDDEAIRDTAMNVADEHHGTIPNASYAMLQDRVTGLDRSIHRYVAGA